MNTRNPKNTRNPNFNPFERAMTKAVQLAEQEAEQFLAFNKGLQHFCEEFEKQAKWGSIITNYAYCITNEAYFNPTHQIKEELKNKTFGELVVERKASYLKGTNILDSITNYSRSTDSRCYILAQYTFHNNRVYMGNLANIHHPVIDFRSTTYQPVTNEQTFFEYLYTSLATVECGRVLLNHRKDFERGAQDRWLDKHKPSLLTL